MSLIEFDNFSYTYPGASGCVLERISLKISAGEFVGIVGVNNSGKSSLCYAMTGVIPQLYHGRAEGEVRVCGQPTSEASVATLAESVAFVMQKPERQLSGVRFTVAEEVAFGLENRGVDQAEMRKRIDRALQLVGLEHMAEKSPHHLSGGQLQRAVLASALAGDAPVIVLDEPTSALDPQGSIDIFGVLSELRSRGRTIVVVEQRMDLLAEYADRIIVMVKGVVVLDGKPGEVLASDILTGTGLQRIRYTRVAGLARKVGKWKDGTGLATTFAEAVSGLQK